MKKILILCLCLSCGLPASLDCSGAEPGGESRRLFIAANSTAKNGADKGWGSHLQQYFDADRLLVENRARGGRSSRTFITEGWWDSLLADVRAGDYVLIQFGHNDAGLINDSLRARGSLPSLGGETREIENLQSGRHEVVRSFGWYMRKMIGEAKAAGATPVVLSMTARNVWQDGRVERANTFCSLAREVAGQTGTLFLDVRNMTADQYELLGQVRTAELFPVDHTHTDSTGARLNAAVVVSGLRALDAGPAGHLSKQGRQVEPYQATQMLRPFYDWMCAAWMPAVQPESDSTLPTLFCIGNSTVRNGRKGDGANGQWGWGAPIADHFDRERLNVENRALGGTSSRTFRSLGLWKAVLDDLKPGDYVVMQFGHNDSSPVNDSARARGTLPGNGNDSLLIDNMLTGREETVFSYGTYLRSYIAEIRSRGATPLVCSPIPRNRWQGDKMIRSVDSYAQWARAAAQQEGAGFIDLNTLIADHYDAVGTHHVSELYFGVGDNTHTSAAGARVNAECLARGLRSLPAHPLAGFLKDPEP